MTTPEARRAVDAMHGWFADTARDLPWRRTRDPWAVLVSEVMLQQTQVTRIAERWPAFLAEFPMPAALAEAPTAIVIERWQGLGYNRRAVNLQRCAVAIVDRHAGVVPDDLDALLALPGIGPYTARAVLAFAFERDVAVVDTNAARVLARAIAGDSLDRRAVQATADAIVPPGTGWVHNQAILDLGAQHCTKRAPDCEACPIVAHCAWQRRPEPGPDPAVGTAGVSTPQSRFEGSDRQGRGRLLRAMAVGALAREEVAAAAGWAEDPTRADRVVAGLVRDGLAIEVELDDTVGFSLPV